MDGGTTNEPIRLLVWMLFTVMLALELGCLKRAGASDNEKVQMN